MSEWDRNRQGRQGGGQGGGTTEEAAHHPLRAFHSDPYKARALHKRYVQRKSARRQASAQAKIPEGGGAPLASDVRSRMEGQLATDLSDVKVHTSDESAEAAEQLGARAFTTGSDIHFGSGQYAPGTKEGDHLLAHELTHTVQAAKSGIQRKAEEGAGEEEHADGAEGAEVSQPEQPAEKEADAVADQVAAGLHGGGGAAEKDAGGEKRDEAAHQQDGEAGGAVKQEAPTIGAKLTTATVSLKKSPPGAAQGQTTATPAGAQGAKADPTQPAAAPGGPTAAAPPPKAGATGILKTEATVKLGGKDVKLPPGTVIEVVQANGDKLKVKVQSGHGGQQAEIPTAAFQAQPGVAVDEDTKKPRDDVYEDFGAAALWGEGGPKAEDAAQGYIGDCYLMAAMGAVCARNPGAIKAAFSPQTPHAKSYSITLHTRDSATGKLKAQTVAVDPQLPSQNQEKAEVAGGAKQDPKLAYAGLNRTAKSAKLWPSLMEKAYAQMVGGYAKAGEGGVPADAMEAITGVESNAEQKPGKDQVIERFKKMMNDGKAVVCATLGSMEHNQTGAFTLDGGEYKAKLTTREGEDCNVIPGTVEIRDNKSKKKMTAADDANGKIVGATVESGSIVYNGGKTTVKFKKDGQPDASENLDAAFDYRGKISKDLELYANHAYVFEKVDGDKLIFRNPWGFLHPKPIDPESFTKFFSGVYSNQVPKPGEKPPGQ